MYIYEYIFIFICNFSIMLSITIVIASLTLIERKVLALIQRRTGPFFVGYKGRLQYIADALKLLFKSIIIPAPINKFWYTLLPSITCLICYIFWINSIWGPNLSIFEIEYNIIYSTLFSLLFGYCIILTGYFSQNKFAILGGIRGGILMLNLEIFLTLFFINVIFLFESFHFSIFVLYQELIWNIFIFFNVIGLIIMVFLLEVNRIPFDLAEAEAELVTGYSIEYGGFYFALYYLGEYFHLFFFSGICIILVCGGWEYPKYFFIFQNYIIF